jgi:hypothetical protein
MKQLKKADEIDVPNKFIKLQGPKQNFIPISVDKLEELLH